MEKRFRVVAGIEDAVILADQFLFGVLTDLAELLVHVGNSALYVRHRYDRVLIKRKLLVGQLPGCSLAGGENP